MKNKTTLISRAKSGALALLFIFCGHSSFSQTDTLHINYDQVKTIPHDTSLAKIDAWVKKLNGMHVDVTVIAYYSKIEFKKYAQERADEMFLVLNRKARNLITIEFIGPKKGANSQRSRVDIVYKKSVSPEELAAAAAKEKEEADKKKETAASEKAAKEKDKKSTSGKTKDGTAAGAAGAAGADAINADKKSGKEDKKGTDSGKDKKEEAEKEKKAEADRKKEKAAYENDANNPGRRKEIGSAIFPSDEEMQLLKTAKIIVPTTNSPIRDSVLHRAVRNFWTFNKNISIMPYGAAMQLAEKDKNVFVFFMPSYVLSESVTHSSGRSKSARGYAVIIEKKFNKPVLAMYFQGIQEQGKSPITEESVSFAVSAMNSLLVNMDEQKISKVKSFNGPFEKNSALLKERTLLIPETFLDTKIKAEEVSTFYHGKSEVVTYSVYKDAILQKKKNYAYVMPVPFLFGGQVKIYDYLMDAESGNVYYINTASAFQGFNVAKPTAKNIGAGLLGVGLANVGIGVDQEYETVDITHSENISEKNLKKYNKAFEKSGKDDDKEEGEGSEEAVKKDDSKKSEAPKEEPKKEDKKKKSKKEKEEEATEKK